MTKHVSLLAIEAEADRMLLAEKLGDIFLDLRISNGLTQREGAKKMETIQSRVYELERGLGDQKISTLIKYARAYGYGLEINLTVSHEEEE